MSEHTMWLEYLVCGKCKKSASPENVVPITHAERLEKYNSNDGWLCKCGHYNAVDP